ncbi:GntR family transcriptional regulator [Arthrobacter sp. NPDC090010]|uniref:GntR family transcriptional regulator n=1 Tax=Arthrobacter sp. NPDC090010 TaxID=3363942 RepID=UPI0038078380
MSAERTVSAASEKAYLELSRRIIVGDLAPGSLLTEGECSVELGMSRTPVREAFLRLSAEGLLRLYPKKGAVVTSDDGAAMPQLLEARLLLEVAGVQAVANDPEARQRHLDELARHLHAQLASATNGDALAFARADHAFHVAVATATGNTILASFYEQLRVRLERLTVSAVRSGRVGLEEFLDQHRRLEELFRAGDASGYEHLLRAHMGVYGAEGFMA